MFAFVNFEHFMGAETLVTCAVVACGFSSTYWEFASGFGVYDPIAKTFRTSLLDALMGN